MDEDFNTGQEGQTPAGDLGIGPEPDQNSFDDYNEFVSAKIGYETRKARAISDQQDVFRQSQAVKQGVRMALDTPPEDPLRQIIRENPSMEAEYQAEAEMLRLEADIAGLGEAKLEFSQAWEEPIVQRGLSKRVHEWNAKNPGGSILVPRETEPFGPVADLRPSNCLFFKLGPAERDRVLRLAENFRTGDENQKVWRALRSLGYRPEMARPTTYPSTEDYERDNKSRMRYEGLTQKQYEALRDKEGAKKF